MILKQKSGTEKDPNMEANSSLKVYTNVLTYEIIAEE